ASLNERREQAARRLAAHGQSHLLAFFDALPEIGQRRLLDQVEALNLVELDRLINELVRSKPKVSIPANVEPAPYYPADPADPRRPWDVVAAREAGEALVRSGRIAVFTVAGGQGTRLGWRGPKGTFPATVVTGKPL